MSDYLFGQATILDAILNEVSFYMNLLSEKGQVVRSWEIHAPPKCADILREKIGSQLSTIPIDIKIVSNEGIEEIDNGDSTYKAEIEVRPIL